MLSRVQRLEIEHVHPMLARIGGEAGWANVRAEVKAGLIERRYDGRDMPFVIDAIRVWIGLLH